MDSQKYHVEMEQWKEDLRAARNQVSLGVLSNYCFYIVSQFSIKCFYRHFKHNLLQGFDVDGDDPREVIQNILLIFNMFANFYCIISAIFISLVLFKRFCSISYRKIERA